MNVSFDSSQNIYAFSQHSLNETKPPLLTNQVPRCCPKNQEIPSEIKARFSALSPLKLIPPILENREFSFKIHTQLANTDTENEVAPKYFQEISDFEKNIIEEKCRGYKGGGYQIGKK